MNERMGQTPATPWATRERTTAGATRHERMHRSWVALAMAGYMGKVPALFVVRYLDEVRWIDVASLEDVGLTIVRRRDHRARNDTEPVIEIPVSQMKLL